MKRKCHAYITSSCVFSYENYNLQFSLLICYVLITLESSSNFLLMMELGSLILRYR